MSEEQKQSLLSWMQSVTNSISDLKATCGVNPKELIGDVQEMESNYEKFRSLIKA